MGRGWKNVRRNLHFTNESQMISGRENYYGVND